VQSGQGMGKVIPRARFATGCHSGAGKGQPVAGSVGNQARAFIVPPLDLQADIFSVVAAKGVIPGGVKRKPAVSIADAAGGGEGQVSMLARTFSR